MKRTHYRHCTRRKLVSSTRRVEDTWNRDLRNSNSRQISGNKTEDSNDESSRHDQSDIIGWLRSIDDFYMIKEQRNNEERKSQKPSMRNGGKE